MAKLTAVLSSPAASAILVAPSIEATPGYDNRYGRDRSQFCPHSHQKAAIGKLALVVCRNVVFAGGEAVYPVLTSIVGHPRGSSGGNETSLTACGDVLPHQRVHRDPCCRLAERVGNRASYHSAAR